MTWLEIGSAFGGAKLGFRLMIAIPLSLTVLRLMLGPLAILLACHQVQHTVYAPLLLAGMLSDYFDGVIARLLGVARPWLRRFDSITDVIFYLCILVTTFLIAGDVMRKSFWPLSLLLASEAACIGISLFRFRTFPATHCYSAKVYGLGLFLAFLGVLCFDFGPPAFTMLAVIGLIANAEVIAILLLSSTAAVDVHSVFHLLRKPISQASIRP